MHASLTAPKLKKNMLGNLGCRKFSQRGYCGKTKNWISHFGSLFGGGEFKPVFSQSAAGTFCPMFCKFWGKGAEAEN